MGISKRCNTCGEVKPVEEFYKAAGCVDGRRGDCRQCFQAKALARAEADPEIRERARRRTAAWIDANEERYRAYKRAYGKRDEKKQADRRLHLKRKFGLTLEDYDAMLAAQRGACAICGDPPGASALHVDHCHDTGWVRGLLCFRCNSAIGNLRDDPVIVASALEYLTRHRDATR